MTTETNARPSYYIEPPIPLTPRRYRFHLIVAALAGALALLTVQAGVSLVHSHSDAFLRSAYSEGYSFGDSRFANRLEGRSTVACVYAARWQYHTTKKDLGSKPPPRGMGAFERGCDAAVQGKPADPASENGESD